jgi:hypothetical protein
MHEPLDKYMEILYGLSLLLLYKLCRKRNTNNNSPFLNRISNFGAYNLTKSDSCCKL